MSLPEVMQLISRYYVHNSILQPANVTHNSVGPKLEAEFSKTNDIGFSESVSSANGFLLTK